MEKNGQENQQEERLQHEDPQEVTMGEDISEILKDSEIDDNEKERKIIAVAKRQVLYSSGPLPSPEQLIKYNEIPGVVETIVDMAVKEQNHRHIKDDKKIDAMVKLNETQEVYIKASIDMKKRQQIFGFIVTIIFIGIGIACLVLDKNITGLVMFIAAIGSFCKIMFFGDKNTDKQDKEINEASEDTDNV